MAYTALYRRYRPHGFGQLVGQEHIARVLAAAVRRGSFVHAYLFCGPRGTGKTSAARILSRAINCSQPLENGDPCGQCAACRREAVGESMDIVEIDGASNRGIDEMRDLRERVRYAPAQEKFKVYIIDEVHMLTIEAFNALLKTLEEPPAHVVFILATTAPHKLPMTVLSRCQRFDFRRIGDADVRRHLLEVAQAESIPLSEDGAALIARKAEGGMRDAISLLDQCAGAYALSQHEQIDAAAVSELLGCVDKSFILELLRLLLQRDTVAALQAVEQLVDSGRDLRQALEDLLEAARDVLLSLLSRQQTPALAVEWAAEFSPQDYLGLLQALADVDSRMRYALSPRVTLELALIQACGAPATPVPPSAPKTPAPTPKTPKPMPSTSTPKLPTPAPKAPKPIVKTQDPAPKASTPQASMPTAAGEALLDRAREQWEDILQRIGQLNPGAQAVMQGTRPDRIEQGRLHIDFPPQMSMMMSIVLSPSGYRPLVEQSLNEILQVKLSIDGFSGAERATTDKAEPNSPPTPDDADAPPESDQGQLF